MIYFFTLLNFIIKKIQYVYRMPSIYRLLKLLMNQLNNTVNST